LVVLSGIQGGLLLWDALRGDFRLFLFCILKSVLGDVGGGLDGVVLVDYFLGVFQGM